MARPDDLTKVGLGSWVWLGSGFARDLKKEHQVVSGGWRLDPECPFCEDQGCPACCDPQPITLDDLEEIQAEMDLAGIEK